MEKVENELSPTEAGYGRLAFYLSNIVAQICVIAVCIMVGIWLGLYGGEPGLDWTNLIHRSHLHPFLTVLAFVFCSTEG